LSILDISGTPWARIGPSQGHKPTTVNVTSEIRTRDRTVRAVENHTPLYRMATWWNISFSLI